ncbi:MAG: RcnB family protein [Comamonas sp.]
MKRWYLSALMAGVMLATGAAPLEALAQPHGRGPDGYGPPGHRKHDHDRRDDRRDWQREHRHDRDFRAPPPPRAAYPRHPGVGPRHDWVRGGYVPGPYRGYTYVVNDWRGHRLSAPPRGYQWIQYGGDYLLIAIGTGLIANIIFSN